MERSRAPAAASACGVRLLTCEPSNYRVSTRPAPRRSPLRSVRRSVHCVHCAHCEHCERSVRFAHWFTMQRASRGQRSAVQPSVRRESTHPLGTLRTLSRALEHSTPARHFPLSVNSLCAARAPRRGSPLSHLSSAPCLCCSACPPRFHQQTLSTVLYCTSASLCLGASRSTFRVLTSTAPTSTSVEFATLLLALFGGLSIFVVFTAASIDTCVLSRYVRRVSARRLPVSRLASLYQLIAHL